MYTGYLKNLNSLVGKRIGQVAENEVNADALKMKLTMEKKASVCEGPRVISCQIALRYCVIL